MLLSAAENPADETVNLSQSQIEQQKALAGVIARMRKSLDLETIFKTTAIEVRSLLKADRVGVFRFSPPLDWEGEFVSEDVAPQWDSAIATKVYDYCFGEQFAVHYQQGKVQAVADIHNADLSNCQIDILAKFQVRANLIVPLLKQKELWGMLCIHQCSNPRDWLESEINFTKQIAEYLTVAIQQAEYLNKVQYQADKQQALTDQLAQATAQAAEAKRQKLLPITIDKIRQSFDIPTIFNTASQEVRQLLQADRVAIYQFPPDWSGTFVAESLTSGWNPLVNIQPIIADTHIQETQGGRYKDRQNFAVDDIYEIGHADCHLALLEQFEAKAYAIAPIFQGEKLWGLLAAYQNSEPRHWQQYEVDLLAQISTQLAVGLQQAEYVKKVQTQAADRQRALATTVEKIRQSLDIDVIFQTATQEVQQLLEVDRVAIYRFYPDWSGEFVADSIVTGGTPIFRNNPEIADGFLQATQAGKYPRHETFVPILQGEKLWGLLLAYQNSQPRYWQDEEINLLAQVGLQLGFALQQAELLTQTRQQAAEISQTLQELKQSQTRLIQGEKMAGLGQLVAGVSQEINNPVNCILGNLTSVNEYTQALLNLISIYHKNYPDPV